jgi:hypothetical protein
VPIAPVFLDQLADSVAAFALTARAFDAQHVELAFNVAEDEISSGHGGLSFDKLAFARNTLMQFVGALDIQARCYPEAALSLQKCHVAQNDRIPPSG